ncbi:MULTISPECIES: tryptophan synthase subunit beta [Kluyvera]|uniref:Tryptophan synthase subunit beta n=1 Tax=Kluyvera sichuanensis TaxID=2725494 RepID=A0ABR6RYA5_9ENTR|nr:MULTISPECIES: tryptophan synthase subunit beta [Kluyvera]MBC1188061.1 tryptophan synthase subunit beta [Kluyvera sichuanensis]MBW9460682.1 tryptophan synthase subunit beta [Kluyvera sp. EC_51]
MHFIERDGEGRIVRVETVAFAGMTEQSEVATAEISEWLKVESIRAATIQQLQQSDLNMIRVLEDLIEVLMSKGIISITDLPPAAQSKLLNRAQARQTLSGLEGLIGDDDERLI